MRLNRVIIVRRSARVDVDVSRVVSHFFRSPTSTTMDALHTQLARIERELAWVQTEPIDWKFLVQCFTWSVTAWELYLL